MTLDNYIQDKGRKELEFNRLTGKAMRIGRRLKQKFAGLTREQIQNKRSREKSKNENEKQERDEKNC